jgi:hypothetical protein
VLRARPRVAAICGTPRCCSVSSRSSWRMGRTDNLTAGAAGSRAREPEGSPAPAQVSDIERNGCPRCPEISDDRLQSLRHCDPPFPVGSNSKLAAASRLSFYITFSPEGVPGDVAAARLRALVFAQVPATARGPGTRWS